MRYIINVLILTFGLLSLNSCSINGVNVPLVDAMCGCKSKTIVKTKYIKNKCPKRATVKSIPSYTITDYKTFDSIYYLINKNQYAKQQRGCHALREQNRLLRGK